MQVVFKINKAPFIATKYSVKGVWIITDEEMELNNKCT